MSFRGATKDERAEWRNMPMTRAALADLKEHIEDCRRDIESLAESGEEREVRFAAGKVKGMRDALDILSEE